MGGSSMGLWLLVSEEAVEFVSHQAMFENRYCSQIEQLQQKDLHFRPWKITPSSFLYFIGSLLFPAVLERKHDSFNIQF
ncbi:hypothetical protein SDJN02_04527, partial [Cucurbita argyrosperma subsp. argyrosperma]